MPKHCMFCNDGQTYSEQMATCPICGNFLKRQENANFNNNRDEYADIFDGISEVVEPVRSSGIQKQNHRATDTPAKKREKVTIGRVRNFHEEEVYTPFLIKWFRSFFKGVPFVFGHTLNTFQVYEDDHSENGYDVVFYGKMKRGRFTDFNRVQVYGKPDYSNSIVAKKIINLNSGSAVAVNSLFSAFFVRLFTAILLFLIVSVIFIIISIEWNLLITNIVDTIFSFLLSLVEPILMLIIVCFGIWIMIKGFFKR